jgi:hypothetical protein
VEVEARVAADTKQPDSWVVDGQQRTTALALLFGRKPYFWPQSVDWSEALKDHDVRFNPFQTTEPYFVLASAVIRRDPNSDWVPVREILNADDERLSEIVDRLRAKHQLPTVKFPFLWSALDRIRKVRDQEVVVVTIDHDLEDVVEIFTRVNRQGTKVTEADVFLALAARHNPSWASKEFLPFIEDLGEAGWKLDPNLIFRTLIAIGAGKTRFKEVPGEFWASGSLKEPWRRCRDSWESIVKSMQGVGILNSDILPTHNALLPLIVLRDHFEKDFKFKPAFACFLEVSKVGRYSGSAFTTLGEDVQLISGSKDFSEAVRKFDDLTPDPVFSPEDFLADHRDEYFRLLLIYLIAYEREAHDWKNGTRLGFEGKDLLTGFTPDWHHIFPKRYLEKNGVEGSKIHALANMAVIDPKTNIRFGAKEPTHYLEKYEIPDEYLEEQLVPTDRKLFTVERFDDFLKLRAKLLADAANDYFQGLRNAGK